MPRRRPRCRSRLSGAALALALALAIGWLASSCAASRPLPRPRSAETAGARPGAPPPRIPDSVPERAAALRAADPNLQLEPEDERWGIEAARERRRRIDEQKSDAQTRENNATKNVPMTPGSWRAADPEVKAPPP